MPFARINGIQTYYETAGVGEPLVLLHNDALSLDVWRRLLPHLEAGHRVLAYDRPFNWSAINNFAARQSRGEFLLFMNNDMEVIAPDWLEALVEHAQRREVGAVGARLVYPDGRVQHAGEIALGLFTNRVELN